MFWPYFKLGWQHILTLGALDHILFVIVLCCAFRIKMWRQLALLITAFTVGHTISLFIAAAFKPTLPTQWIETGIVLSIMLTGVYNILWNKGTKSNVGLTSALAVVFGLLHGLGFSSKILPLLRDSKDLIWTVLSFNIGVEVGQLVVFAIYAFITFLVIEVLNREQRDWKFWLSGTAFGAGLVLLVSLWQ